MKSTNEIEVIGFGKFKTYNIKVEERTFENVNKDLKPIKKVLVQKGTPSLYKWEDPTGQEVIKQDIGFNINGSFIQKIERSKTIKKFKIIDKKQIAQEILNFNVGIDGQYILYGDTTSNMNLEAQIGNDKAIEFVYKSSSIGTKFRRAVILKLNELYVMLLFKKIAVQQAQEQFKLQLQAVSQLEELKEEIFVKCSADELQIEI